MTHSCWDKAEVARTQLAGLPADFRAHPSFQDVEAFFKRVQMRLDDSARLQEADAHPHVHRAHPVIDIGGAAETRAMGFVKVRRSGVGWVDPGDEMHGSVKLIKKRTAPGDLGALL